MMKEIKQGNLFVAIESPAKTFQGENDVLPSVNTPYFSHWCKVQKDHIVPLANFGAVSYVVVVHDIKNVYRAEQTTNRIQITYEQQEIFVSYTGDKGLLSRIYKELQKLNNNKQSCQLIDRPMVLTVFKKK